MTLDSRVQAEQRAEAIVDDRLTLMSHPVVKKQTALLCC
jgi:hypothetical protein